MDDLTLDKRTDGAVPARKPRDDVERVDHLRQFCILDTGSDPRFDRITQLVSELLVMPIVLVSLVDEAREWFKSKVGTEIAEILRDHGFCSHALHLEGNGISLKRANPNRQKAFALYFAQNHHAVLRHEADANTFDGYFDHGSAPHYFLARSALHNRHSETI